jgi:hypothetical protein
MPILRRTNCIITASDIVALEISERSYFISRVTIPDAVIIVCPSEDGHVDARNMSRIVM